MSRVPSTADEGYHEVFQYSVQALILLIPPRTTHSFRHFSKPLRGPVLGSLDMVQNTYPEIRKFPLPKNPLISFLF